jgi:hypothetical protein
MKLLSVLVFAFFTSAAFAQENYLFPQFVTGQIYYKETAIAAMLNYNLFSSDIFILDGDKHKRLEDVDRIENVNVGIKKFTPLNDNTFGEIIVDGDLVLAVKYSGHVEKANDNVKSISKTALNKALNSGEPLPEGITIKRDSSYYFVKQRNEKKAFYLPGANVEKANRLGITKLFLKNKSEIDSFIENNKINFSSFESLKQLVEFCEKYTVK